MSKSSQPPIVSDTFPPEHFGPLYCVLVHWKRLELALSEAAEGEPSL